MTLRTLIADDQPDVLEALRLLLKREGYQIEVASSPAAILAKIESQPYDLLLMDLNYARDTTSGQEGLDLLHRIRAIDGTLPVVVMTAWGTVPLAVEAMRRGVSDFVQKPWQNHELLATLRRQMERGQDLRRSEHLRAERQWLAEQELQQAQEIERGLLPGRMPQMRGCEIAAARQAAHAVGGDYFDIFPFSDSKAGIAIADVMGKGLPAALLMANLQAAVRATVSETIAPAELCSKVNQLVCRNLSDGRFATFFYGLLDTAAGRLSYANAGHVPPLLLRTSGERLRLHEGGTVLGIFPRAPYGQNDVRITPGDRLAFFTDGVTEASDAAGNEFGEERLAGVAAENPGRHAGEVHRAMMDAVTQFTGGRAQDDATLVVVCVSTSGLQELQ